MRNYQLVEKSSRGGIPIAWEVRHSTKGDVATIELQIRYSKGTEKVDLGSGISETKRGWTIEVPWLTTRVQYLFLPREDFDKIEI